MIVYLRRVTGPIWGPLQDGPTPDAVGHAAAELIAELPNGGVSVWRHSTPEQLKLIAVAVAIPILGLKGPLRYVEILESDLAAVPGLSLVADAASALTPIEEARQFHYNLVGTAEDLTKLVTQLATRLKGTKPVQVFNERKLREATKELLARGIEGVPSGCWMRE